MAEVPTAELVAPRRRPLGFELAVVVVVSCAILIPGIWSYSLIDPWETHYGEVARAMLETNDYVHTSWPGTPSGKIGDNEGFRSKPVLSFWMMAAGMRALGVGEGGGYSGEMTDSVRTMIGVRLPFILAAICGLTLVWWMLARLVSRRMAWLALLVVGTAPMFCMIARNAIPDMPLTACTMGALALFFLAIEDGDRPIATRAIVLRRLRGGVPLDARHLVVGAIAAFVLIQAIYDAIYFTVAPQLAFRDPTGRMIDPAIWLPGMMVALVAALSRDGWLILRLPFVLIGGVIAAIVNEPMPVRRAGQSLWRHVFDDVLAPWNRHALDRYLVRALVFPIAWADGGGWPATAAIAERLLAMSPLATMRQLYLLGCYFLLGVSVLAKGPPGLTVVGAVGVLHVVLFWRWRELYAGGFELKRGLLTMSAVAVPWHIGMYLKEGVRFKDEYLYTHILNRAAVGVDNSPGSFEHYTSQLGHGMWLWAALLPAALTALFLRARRDTRDGRIRFLVGVWAIVAVAVFSLVQTKFHHYILPAVPPLCLVVAFFLDDLVARRDRLHPLFAALAAAIALLICRDLMFEPERWIEMFTFRYDRPWPAAEPWSIDPSDGFLGLGLAAALAIALTATRFVRLGVAALGAAGLAICVWALQVYMPIAGTHWGMRDAIRTYYEQRTVYGEKIVYFDPAQIRDEWSGAGDVHAFDTLIPDALQLGQPMTIKIRLHKPDDERVMEAEVALRGEVTAIADHTVAVTLAPGERARLGPLMARASKPGKRARPPVRVVDADRLIAWQLYWRGENFWSGGEIWDYLRFRDVLPELKTSFVKNDNVEIQAYLKDPTRAPAGRRYFVVTEAGRINSVRSLLPPRGRESFVVLDTTSNKFSLAAFEL